MEVVYHKKVSFHETDLMGVVHHAVYAKYFEDARVELLDTEGLAKYHAPENPDYILAVMELKVSYFRPLRVREAFEVRVKMEPQSETRFLFTYEIYKGEELCTKGHSLHVGLNSQLKVVKPPFDFIEWKTKQNK